MGIVPADPAADDKSPGGAERKPGRKLHRGPHLLCAASQPGRDLNRKSTRGTA